MKNKKALFSKRNIIIIAVCLILTALIPVYSLSKNSESKRTAAEVYSESFESRSEEISEKSEPVLNDSSGISRAHFVCVGDNLIHDNIYEEAKKLGGGNKYDFTHAYEHVEKYIKGADVAVVNQETIITDNIAPSSYPCFSTPAANGDKLAEIGFNAVSMSNNHILDYGESGLLSTIEYWNKNHPGIVHYGAYSSSEDMNNIKTLTKNGITFSFLGYMEHTNGNFLQGDGAKLVYLSQEDVIKEQIKKAKEISDVVVVSCHFGTEISNELNEQQKELAPKLAEWGADLIIGTQAHTISTCEYITRGDGSKAFVYYGLGNFISTMYDTKSLVGLIGDLDVVKNNSNGKITFENIKAIPVISHFEADSYNSMWTNCTVYPYCDYTDDLLEKNFVSGFSKKSINDCLSYIPKKFLAIE